MPHTNWPNTFRQALLAQQRSIGCWVALGSAVSSEIMGYAGFDWLLLDGEHGPNDLSSFASQLTALKDSDSAVVVRPQWAEPVILKRLLDLGAFNFLMPFIESEEQARQAVSATRYPPDGTRGVAVAHRSNLYGYRKDYFERVNDNISVMVQIESVKGLENVDAIAAVPGVDALFVGPSDLSASLGHFLKPREATVQNAIRKIYEAGKRHGKSVGILAVVPEDAQRYLDLGINVVAAGADVRLLRDASLSLRKSFSV